MRLAVALSCALAGNAIADPGVERVVGDVEEMVRHDCAHARQSYVDALARCTGWSCGEFVQMPDVCRLRWSEPAPPLETTLRESQALQRKQRTFLVEILRSAEEIVDMNPR